MEGFPCEETVMGIILGCGLASLALDSQLGESVTVWLADCLSIVHGISAQSAGRAVSG